MIDIKNNVSRWIATAFVLILPLVLRLPLLDGSFWLDEAAQALESARPFSEQLLIRDDFQPPLLHFLLHFAMYINDTEWWLRTIGALIPGIITVYYTYKIGCHLVNQRVGLMAAALLSTSSFHIFYSQELRQYSLPAAFAIVAWYILIVAWKSASKPSVSMLCAFVLLTVGGLYSSYLYPFALIAQALWLLFIDKKYKNYWLAALSASILLFSPWLPGFLDQLQAGTQLQKSLPGWSTVVSPTQLKSLPLVVAKFLFGVQNVDLNVLFISIVGFLAISLVLALIKIKRKYTIFAPVVIWLVVPIIAAWLISFWVPVLQPKRVLFCLPAFYLVVSAIAYLSNAETRTNKRVATKSKASAFTLDPGLLAVLVLLIINITGTVSYWTNPLLQRENWRTLISSIEEKYPKYSTTLFAFPEPFAPWRWYADNSYPALATGELLLTDEAALSTIKKASEHDHVLVFDYLRDLSDPERKLDGLLIEYGYKQTELLEYPAIGFIRIYSKPTAVISYR